MNSEMGYAGMPAATASRRLPLHGNFRSRRFRQQYMLRYRSNVMGSDVDDDVRLHAAAQWWIGAPHARRRRLLHGPAAGAAYRPIIRNVQSSPSPSSYTCAADYHPVESSCRPPPPHVPLHDTAALIPIPTPSAASKAASPAAGTDGISFIHTSSRRIES